MDSFKYDFIKSNKKDIPVLTIKDKTYRAIDTNGFIKVTNYPLADIYHYSQVYLDHSVPDWKIHFSIQKEYVAQAWDILIELFIKYELFAMKVCTTVNSTWPLHMIGREITVCIPIYSDRYVIVDDINNFEEPLTNQIEIDKKVWFDFIIEATDKLKANQIKPNPINQGDQKINDYCSLRNEAFCYITDHWKPPSGTIWSGYNYSPRHINCQWIYPPNEYGHNAHDDMKPFHLKDLKLYKMKKMLKLI